ncbi:hypothetical protein AXW67_36170 [Bradyrhizobium neotropicale]|uniref:Uncharacterized protein n=1 Tax=Bradyrhizobium neotropicale TaxID=1497615 RepID=A0A176ZIN0_9BRAD|nr:hypothetical protein AXW67_36170 [Bradyrhizobium neotropicale]
MAIQTRGGMVSVSPWKGKAEVRQTTPFGTSLPASARVWCVSNDTPIAGTAPAELKDKAFLFMREMVVAVIPAS